MALEVHDIPIDELTPADYNPRTIDPKKAEGLQRSLDEFGFLDPVIVNQRTGNVVGGHQRIDAARALEHDTVPVVYVDLDPDREKALNLALNQYVGEWDVPKLVDLLDTLDTDLRELAGFDLEELESVRFHYRRKRKAGNTDADRYGRDNRPQLPDDPDTKPGDVYKIGVHTLICGDSTDPDIWASIARPDLVVTSPPYPGANMWNTDDEGDEFTANVERLRNLHLEVLDHALEHADVVAWNIADVPIGKGKVAKNTNDVRNHLDTAGYDYREIIWDKGIPVLPPVGHVRRPVLNSITNELIFIASHQPIFVVYPDSWKPREKESGLADGQHEWQLRSVWNIAPAKRSAVGHIAPFPLELAERCIYLYTLAGDIVVDPFAGAGTTLIAAENTGRTSILIELEPGWCDVIINRVQNELDLEAELVDDA